MVRLLDYANCLIQNTRMRLRLYEHVRGITLDNKRVFSELNCAQLAEHASIDAMIEFERENGDIAPDLILGIHKLVGFQGVLEYFRDYKYR